MGRFVLRRAVGLVVVLFAMILAVFLLRQVIPADPARAAAGPNAPEEVVEAKREALGLNDPVLVQFGTYVADLVRGDLGVSARTGNPVREDLATFLPASVELVGFALVIGAIFGVGFAVLQSLTPRAAWTRPLFVSGASMPAFLTGLLLLLLFWFRLGWLPGGGRSDVADAPTGPTGLLVFDGLLHARFDVVGDALAHVLLPGIALGIPMAVAIGRTLQSSLVNVLRQDYVRTARAKGLTELRVLRQHGLRNASTAAFAMAGLQIGLLLANLLIVERIFAWPGLGLYTVQALGRSDLTAVLGVTLVFGVTYVVVNALVDVAQAWADPRVSMS